jgi:hypothetical protein
VTRPVLLALLVLVAGCWSSDEGDGEPFVARVGEATLTEQDLAELLPAEQATDEALRGVLVQQWIDRQLLLQEASEQGIFDRADVQRQIQENTEALAIGALVERTIASTPFRPSAAEQTRYYQRHRANLLLEEPHVRFSAFFGRTRAAAEEAQAQARRVPAEAPAWASIDDAANVLTDSIAAERALPFEDPALVEALRALPSGRVSSVLQSRGQFVVLVAHERREAGDQPPQPWVRDLVLDRLRIDSKRTALRRLVSSLRDQAQSTGALVVGTPDSAAVAPAISADTLR